MYVNTTTTGQSIPSDEVEMLYSLKLCARLLWIRTAFQKLLLLRCANDMHVLETTFDSNYIFVAKFFSNVANITFASLKCPMTTITADVTVINVKYY